MNTVVYQCKHPATSVVVVVVVVLVVVVVVVVVVSCCEVSITATVHMLHNDSDIQTHLELNHGKNCQTSHDTVIIDRDTTVSSSCCSYL